MQTKLFRLTVLNTLLLSGFAAAETVPAETASAASEPAASAELETIYITAEAQAKQQLGSSLITKQDLQRTPVSNDIADIVSKMPGVTLSTNSPGGARGNKRQIDIRGMGPENTLILIDGKPVRSRNAERYGRGGVRNTRGDSNWVPPEMIEKIEVLRGPAAARYGSGAMGGVVNIRTKSITREFHGSVGTYLEQPQDGTQQGATRRANFIVSGPIVQDTLGFRLYGSLNKTSPDDFDINGSTNTGSTINAGREGVRNRDIAGRLQWDISPTQRLTFDAAYSRQGNIYNGDTQSSNVLVPAVRNVAFPLIGSETARLYRQSYTLTHNGNWEWGDLESYISFDKTVNSRLPEGLLGSTEGAYNSTTGFSDSILKNYRFGSRADLPLGRHTLTVGAEGGRSVLDDSASMKQTMQTYGNIPWLASTGRSGKGSQNDFAIYVEDNISLNQGRTFLTPGLRWDYNTAFGSTFSPSFNFSHALNDNWRIKGGIARAFKAPNLYQTQPNYMLTNASHGCPIDEHNRWDNPNAQNNSATGGTGAGNDQRPTNPYLNSRPGGFDWGRACYFVGNKDIKPETSINKEIGFEFNKDGYLASLAYFHNDYRNRIVDNGEFVTTIDAPPGGYNRDVRRTNNRAGINIWRNYTATNVYRWGNRGKAVLAGFEGNVTLPLIADKLNFSTNFTYFHRNEEKFYGNPVSIVPKYTINSTLNWQITPEWDLNATYTRYGRQKTGSRPTRFLDVYYEDGGSKLQEYELGSYGVFGFNVGYNWKDTVSLRAGVNNLFDKTILRTAGTANTYNERRRSFFFNARYSF